MYCLLNGSFFEKGVSILEQFIYYLAETKYRLYHELHIFKPCAYTEEECTNRIKAKHKYETNLETIAMLPLEQQLKLERVEKEYFSDAPYVSK
jgi:hypothetical protein